jgi:hypothetical protein
MIRTLPSALVNLIREEYPQVQAHTNIGSARDHNVISGLLAGVESVDERMIPAAVATRLVTLLGTIGSALRA